MIILNALPRARPRETTLWHLAKLIVSISFCTFNLYFIASLQVN